MMLDAIQRLVESARAFLVRHEAECAANPDANESDELVRLRDAYTDRLRETRMRELAQALVDGADALALLMDLEWSGSRPPAYEESAKACPECEVDGPNEKHSSRCKLARLIGAPTE